MRNEVQVMRMTIGLHISGTSGKQLLLTGCNRPCWLTIGSPTPPLSASSELGVGLSVDGFSTMDGTSGPNGWWSLPGMTVTCIGGSFPPVAPWTSSLPPSGWLELLVLGASGALGCFLGEEPVVYKMCRVRNVEKSVRDLITTRDKTCSVAAALSINSCTF